MIATATTAAHNQPRGTRRSPGLWTANIRPLPDAAELIAPATASVGGGDGGGTVSVRVCPSPATTVVMTSVGGRDCGTVSVSVWPCPVTTAVTVGVGIAVTVDVGAVRICTVTNVVF